MLTDPRRKILEEYRSDIIVALNNKAERMSKGFDRAFEKVIKELDELATKDK